MRIVKVVPLFVVFVAAVVSPRPASAQTYSLHGGQNAPPNQTQKPGKTAKGKKGGAAPTGPRTLGWGSNIKIARQAKAAENALKKGQYGLAANYAQAAANAAPQDPKLWFLLGYTARLAGRLGTSVSAFQHGLQLAPNEIEGLSGLAQTYMKMGRPQDAKPLLLRVIASNPKRPNELMIAGELFLQTGDAQQAVGYLQRAEALKPNTHSEVLLAIGFQKLKQPAKAKSYLMRAEQRAPGNVDVLRAVAGFYRDTGEYPQAIKALLSIKKPTPAVISELAYTYQLAGDRENSAKYYTRAADMDPKDLGRQLSAAQAHLNAGNMERANKYLQRAYAIDPNNYRVHNLRGEVALRNGDRNMALQEFKAALATLPAEGVPEGPLFPIHLNLNLYALYRDGGEGHLADEQLNAAHTKIDALQMANNADYLRMRGQIRMYLNDLAGASADLKQAIALEPKNAELLSLMGDVLWKMRALKEAANYYQAALKIDPKNRSALSSMGYLSRAFHDRPAAERYFNALAAAYPKDYTPHLALGDMDTEHHEYDKAQGEYFIAWKLAPTNALVVAGGANAAIEHKKFDLAKLWLDRAQGAMNDEPKLMRERERYLTWTKNYAESARIGYRVIKKMPNDRDVVVYLGYDLLFMGRYDDLLKLVEPYETTMPNEPDLPLLAGYAHKYGQLYDQAIDDFSRSLKLNPKIVTAYVNRGYLYNSVGDPKSAIGDFNSALTFEPNNGEAHLGLGYANLELREYKTALQQIDIAAQTLKDEPHIHLARATAYRGQNLFAKAETEYRLVAQANPGDPEIQIGLGNVLLRESKYHDSIAAFEQALRDDPENAEVLAQIAHDYAALHDRENTLRYVTAAEKAGDYRSDVMLSTGDALLLLGDENAALQHYENAMNAADADRIQVRLSIARLMVGRNEFADAHEQLGLAFAEARIGESNSVTADHLLQAANLLTKMRDFDLAERMFNRAHKAGAADEVIAMGLANLYVAQGQPNRAEAELASLGTGLDYSDSYQLSLLQGEIYRERHENLRALAAFARANENASPEDDTARRAMLELAGNEGMRVTSNLSLQSDFVRDTIFDDPTVYMLDTQEQQQFGGLNAGQNTPPRSPTETLWNTGWRVHLNHVPIITGFVQALNVNGDVSIPSEDRIINIDSTDLSAAVGLSPVLRMGRAVFNFNTGIQYTQRRTGKNVAFFLDENMFRPYLYMSTNPLFNWLTISGFGSRETGTFTKRLLLPGQFLDSKDYVGKLDFKVGRPWGSTAMLTGYWVRDIQFTPLARERYATASYVGVEHHFSPNFSGRLIGEYIRAWRVHDNAFFEAQAMRPSVSFTYQKGLHWRFDGDFAYARGETIHTYDNAHTDFLVTYMLPVHRSMNDGTGETSVQYPLRFSFGLQQEQYFDFTGTGQSRFRPVVRLSVF